MYGGIEKTPEMKAADEAYIAGVAKTGLTRQQAAIELVKRGMKTLNDGDAAVAIQRFNQAWLLDPNYSGVYVGFGEVLSDRKNDDEAETMFKRAIELPSVAADAYASYAMFLNKQKRTPEAIGIVEQAVAQKKQDQFVYLQGAMAYWRAGDEPTACDWAGRALPGFQRGSRTAMLVEEVRRRTCKQIGATTPTPSQAEPRPQR